MKLFCLAAALSILQAAPQENADLAGIHTVYLLPMTYSLDQFLAIRLTRGAILQVVTDPQKADAVLSDHIGSVLEDKMNALYGEQKADKDKDGKDKEKDKSPSFVPPGGGARSKGAIFLVDRRTRNVVWSDYVRPKNSQADELNHVADRIAAQLEKDRKPKKDK